MSQQCVAALYDSFESAKQAIEALDQAGYPADQVSLVTRDVKDQISPDEVPPSGDKAEANAAKGAGLGGLLGTLLASPLVMVTGFGATIIAGPLGAGLAGAIVGGFLGAMSGWGVDKNRVEEYEEKVKAGSVLLVAHGDPAQVSDAHRILSHTPNKTLHLHTPTSANADEIDDRPS